jgi:DNA-binding winged helix-turn-helix (wHTH) protein/pimeloyl-ACP methyl ester carboxylesterase
MIYSFEEFELDPTLRELRIGNASVDVEPQVFDLLVYLVDNAEHVVSKNELIEHIWAGRIVSESTLSSRINAARRAVGDDGTQQRLIRTIPRRGFRFIGEISNHGDENNNLPLGRIPTQADAKTGVSEQKIRVCQSSDGTQIAHATTGVGYPLVRAGHFLTHLEHDWRDPIWRPFLETLGQSFSVTRYDQRGCGLSDWSSTDFSIENFVQDLSAVIEAAELDTFALYATSQGGPVAIEYAKQNPERVTHLILHGSYAAGRMIRDSQAEREQAEALHTLIRHGWGKQDSAFLQAFVSFYAPDATREQMDSLVELQKQSTSAENAAALRQAVDAFDVRPSLARITVPTLVTHARGDNVHPIDQGRALAAGIRGAELMVYESVNHIPLPQDPATRRVHETLRRFVIGATE